MFSVICNLVKLIAGMLHRRGRVVCLICLALVAVSSGCRQDSAQWKVAAAINEEAKGNSEAAVELLQKALRMDPDSDDIKLRLALLLAKNDQGDLSLTLCDQILENDPMSKYAWSVRSDCLHAMGRFDESLAAYQKYVADKIDKAPSELNQLAYFRALAGVELDKALRQINEAIDEYEQQFVPVSLQESGLFGAAAPTWGAYSRVPIEINTVVSAGLLSRYTEHGHQHVIGLLSDKIHDEQQLWLAANAQFDLLMEEQESLVADATEQEKKEQQAVIKSAAGLVDKFARNLPVLLAARSLMLEAQGQTELADLDRLWLKQIGVQPQGVYNKLPSDMECMAALSDVEAILDTRGYILTQLPWLPTWTHPSGNVMKLKDQGAEITYGNYEFAIHDLDLAITAAEIRLMVLSSDAVNRIEYSIKSIRGDKANGAKLLAILRDHRRQAHLKANQIEAAQRDQERIEELGFEDGNLF